MLILLFLVKTIVVVVAIATLYILLSLLSIVIPVNTKFHHAEEGITCYLCSDGIHTDFVLPVCNEVHDWKRLIKQECYENRIVDGNFIGFGWGDRGFYLDIPTWNDLTFKVAFKAMVIPSKTLMHVKALNTLPRDKKKFSKMVLNPEQYKALCDYIYSYFKLENGEPILLAGKGYSPNDNFYEALSKYHALNTCNFWVNRGLIRVGVRTSFWSPSDRGIFYQLGRVKR